MDSQNKQKQIHSGGYLNRLLAQAQSTVANPSDSMPLQRPEAALNQLTAFEPVAQHNPSPEVKPEVHQQDNEPANQLSTKVVKTETAEQHVETKRPAATPGNESHQPSNGNRTAEYLQPSTNTASNKPIQTKPQSFGGERMDWPQAPNRATVDNGRETVQRSAQADLSNTPTSATQHRQPPLSKKTTIDEQTAAQPATEKPIQHKLDTRLDLDALSKRISETFNAPIQDSINDSATASTISFNAALPLSSNPIEAVQATQIPAVINTTETTKAPQHTINLSIGAVRIEQVQSQPKLIHQSVGTKLPRFSLNDYLRQQGSER